MDDDVELLHLDVVETRQLVGLTSAAHISILDVVTSGSNPGFQSPPVASVASDDDDKRAISHRLLREQRPGSDR